MVNPGFHGGTTSQGVSTNYLAKFLPNLHENEKSGLKRWGDARSIAPLGSTTVMDSNSTVDPPLLLKK